LAYLFKWLAPFFSDSEIYCRSWEVFVVYYWLLLGFYSATRVQSMSKYKLCYGVCLFLSILPTHAALMSKRLMHREAIKMRGCP